MVKQCQVPYLTYLLIKQLLNLLIETYTLPHNSRPTSAGLPKIPPPIPPWNLPCSAASLPTTVVNPRSQVRGGFHPVTPSLPRTSGGLITQSTHGLLPWATSLLSLQSNLDQHLKSPTLKFSPLAPGVAHLSLCWLPDLPPESQLLSDPSHPG